jgi:xanthine phosphoribosyltransferase
MKDFISWQLVDECVTEIAFHLKDTGKDFVGVFGIPRGGVILAVMLSHKLDIPYITEFWRVGDGDIVVIDDIADTGKTLQWYKEQPETKDGHYVTIHEHKQSIVKPDYSVLYKQDKWIVYPWEVEESEEVQDYLR